MNEYETFRRVVALIQSMHELQRKKVISLARRIKPGLTDEDIRNPHDFPELDDPDWHFEDGQLAALDSVLIALRSFEREHEFLTHAESSEKSGQ